MTRTPNDRSDFNQILQALREDVSQLTDGTRLPTVRDLAAKHNTTQYSVQQAIQHLKAEGLVSTYVGRGTFVGESVSQPTEGGVIESVKVHEWNVLTLSHVTPSQRGEEITHLLHQRLQEHNHRSLVLTYGDPDDAIAMVRNGPKYKVCIIQPRQSQIPVSLLSVLRERSEVIIVEGRVLESLNTDAITRDRSLSLDLALRHLVDLGHRKVCLISEAGLDSPGYDEVVRVFRTLHSWAGLPNEIEPVILAPAREIGFIDLSEQLKTLIKQHGQFPFSAAIISSNELGQQLVQDFTEAQLSIPNDISIVRLRPSDNYADHLDKITTVGRTASQVVDALLQQIEWRLEHPDEPYRTIFDPPQLVVRKSTRRLSGQATS